MKTYPGKYHYTVCPYCRSKKIVLAYIRKAVGYMATQKRLTVMTDESDKVEANHYFCGNCNRVFQISKAKGIIDRAEIRRDINRLKAYLAKKGRKAN